MNPIGHVFLILGFTFVIAFVSYYVFGVKGPWENFWIKSLLLFLFLLAASLWIKPIGPTWYGVQWLVLFIGALLFILLLATFSSSDGKPKIPTNISLTDRKRLFQNYMKQRGTFFFSMGMMFWLLIAVFIIIIAFGYYL